MKHDPDLSRATWRKSSRSGGNGGDCVEIATVDQTIAVRDSKAPDAGHLAVSAASFAGLLARVKRDELNL